MFAAIEHLRVSRVQVASLNRDGALVKAPDEHVVDIEEVGGARARHNGT